MILNNITTLFFILESKILFFAFMLCKNKMVCSHNSNLFHKFELGRKNAYAKQLAFSFFAKHKKESLILVSDGIRKNDAGFIQNL